MNTFWSKSLDEDVKPQKKKKRNTPKRSKINLDTWRFVVGARVWTKKICCVKKLDYAIKTNVSGKGPHRYVHEGNELHAPSSSSFLSIFNPVSRFFHFSGHCVAVKIKFILHFLLVCGERWALSIPVKTVSVGPQQTPLAFYLLTNSLVGMPFPNPLLQCGSNWNSFWFFFFYWSCSSFYWTCCSALLTFCIDK